MNVAASALIRPLRRSLLPAAMPGAVKRKSDAPTRAIKRARLDVPPIDPFSVDALRTALKKDPLSPADGPSSLDLLELELATLDPSWMQALSSELRQPYFLDLKRFLWQKGLRSHDDPKLQIFPRATDVYAWSRHTPLHKVRVVILGQDPYHNAGQAHGLSFSVKHGVPVPPSLKNIYKELANQYPGFVPPKHGNLEAWAKAGVLLLNASLTVTAHQAGSHAGQGWEDFTSAVVKAVDATTGVVFLAWGKPAEKAVAKVDHSKHLVLTSVHPSPLSASRGFFHNSHFVKANDWLRERYGEEGTIDWTALDKPTAEMHTSSLHKQPKPTTADGQLAAALTSLATSRHPDDSSVSAPPAGDLGHRAQSTVQQVGGENVQGVVTASETQSEVLL